MHLATPESCFQALTADECHREIQTHLPRENAYWSLSFRGAFEALAKDTFSPSMRQIIAASGPLNLFALTSGKSLVKIRHWISSRTDTETLQLFIVKSSSTVAQSAAPKT